MVMLNICFERWEPELNSLEKKYRRVGKNNF